MKIFYAVQATGNGHISRALEIIPFLEKYGEVHVFLSGNNYGLNIGLPIVYRSKGLSFQYDSTKGSIDLKKTFKSINFSKIWTESKYLPVEKYDLVINDFEFITSLACRIKGIASVHFGHQASFRSKFIPRPQKYNHVSEWFIRNFVKAEHTIGLHFKHYDPTIFQPIIRQSILNAKPSTHDHVTVYLGHYGISTIFNNVKELKDIRFEVFSKEVMHVHTVEHVTFYPVHTERFTQSLLTCRCLITGAGFETPAEALYLKKNMMLLPVQGQYEQLCNAEALKEFNVPILDGFTENFYAQLLQLIESSPNNLWELKDTTSSIVQHVVEKGIGTIRMSDRPKASDQTVNKITSEVFSTNDEQMSHTNVG